MAAKKKKARAAKRMTKTTFIRSFGPDVPADEIVAKGKAAGLSLTKKYVWTQQSEMRRGGKKASKSTTPSRAGAAAPAATKGRRGSRKSKRTDEPTVAANAREGARPYAGDAEQRMRALIIELGTARADRLYREMRAQLDAIVHDR